MNFALPPAANPLVLLACLAAGLLTGWVWPAAAVVASPVTQAGMALLNMAAMPLIIVATAFGLRQTLALPHRGWRLFMLLLVGAVVLWGCAQLGVLAAHVAGTGLALEARTLQEMGALVHRAGGEAQSTAMQLFGGGSGAVAQSGARLELPDNFFAALASGDLPALLWGSVVFGAAFAVQQHARSQALAGQLEALYRGLEAIIVFINRGLPLLLFGVAVQFAALADAQTLRLMGSFLGLFVALVLALGAAALTLVRRHAQATLLEVLGALKYPMLLSLASASPVSAIPATIEALSARLGLSRGIVDLLVPASAVFLRAGAALHFALLAVFVAHLYGHALDAQELMLVALMAAVAALASAGSGGVASLGFAALVVGALGLPFEAALPLFVAIDLLCEGPRNLLSVLCCCAVVALVCGGLPSERQAAQGADKAAAAPHAPVHFALSRRAALLALLCLAAAALLSIALGVGLGMRQASSGAALSAPAPAAERHLQS